VSEMGVRQVQMRILKIEKPKKNEKEERDE
jgi:hypothetical protein